MKKKVTIISLAALLAAALGINLTASAIETASPIEEQYFSAKENLSTEKDTTVNHSHFTAGNNVDNNSKVQGILFSAGNTVSQNNTSEYSFIAGNSINIKGQIEKDLFVAGNSINIDPSTVVNRDLYILGNNVTINSEVKGNVFVAGNSFKVSEKAKIGGNLEANVTTMEFNSQAKVAGTFNYNDDASITNLDSNNFGLVTTYHQDETTQAEKSPLSSAIGVIIKIFASIITIAAICFVFPRSKKLFVNVTQEHNAILKYFGIGLAVLILTPFVCLLLLCTVIGAPLSIVLAVIYAIAIYLSINLASIHLGRLIFAKVFNQTPNTAASIITGVILANLVLIIPIFGAIYAIFAICYGLGIFAGIIYHNRNKIISDEGEKKPKAKKEEKPILLAKK